MVTLPAAGHGRALEGSGPHAAPRARVARPCDRSPQYRAGGTSTAPAAAVAEIRAHGSRLRWTFSPELLDRSYHAVEQIIPETTNNNGAEIAVLKNSFEMSGYYNIQWNASQYSSGVYFIEMVSDNFREVRKIIHMK